MKILKKVAEGEKLPPFHHIAYKDPTFPGYTTAPIPLIPLIRLYRSILYHIKPSIYDRLLKAEYHRGYNEGYRIGYARAKDAYLDIATRPTITYDPKLLKHQMRELFKQFKELRTAIKK